MPLTHERLREIAEHIAKVDTTFRAMLPMLGELEGHYKSNGEKGIASLLYEHSRALAQSGSSLHALSMYATQTAAETPQVVEELEPDEGFRELCRGFADGPRTSSANNGGHGVDEATEETCIACGRKPGSTPGCACDDR